MLGVVVASEGYPNTVQNGHALPNLDVLPEDVAVYYAGAKKDGDQFVGNGGRVLLVTATADCLKDAKEKVYAAIDEKQWPHFFYRRDIGWRTFEHEVN